MAIEHPTCSARAGLASERPPIAPQSSVTPRPQQHVAANLPSDKRPAQRLVLGPGADDLRAQQDPAADRGHQRRPRVRIVPRRRMPRAPVCVLPAATTPRIDAQRQRARSSGVGSRASIRRPRGSIRARVPGSPSATRRRGWPQRRGSASGSRVSRYFAAMAMSPMPVTSGFPPPCVRCSMARPITGTSTDTSRRGARP